MFSLIVPSESFTLDYAKGYLCEMIALQYIITVLLPLMSKTYFILNKHIFLSIIPLFGKSDRFFNYHYWKILNIFIFRSRKFLKLKNLLIHLIRFVKYCYLFRFIIFFKCQFEYDKNIH